MQSNDESIEDTYPTGTFRNLFWKEQLKCAMATDARQMRWHPTMVFKFVFRRLSLLPIVWISEAFI
jgi:hypothetical protein